MVPLKFIAAKFGASISVNAKKLEATVQYHNQKTSIPKVEIRNGRTFVPLRAVMNMFQKQIYYHQGLIIITGNISLDPLDQQNKLAAEQIRKVLLYMDR
ncbi:hypothetical protein D3C79_988060 [compost metagenome]